jgi:hypothetical protein
MEAFQPGPDIAPGEIQRIAPLIREAMAELAGISDGESSCRERADAATYGFMVLHDLERTLRAYRLTAGALAEAREQGRRECAENHEQPEPVLRLASGFARPQRRPAPRRLPAVVPAGILAAALAFTTAANPHAAAVAVRAAVPAAAAAAAACQPGLIAPHRRRTRPARPARVRVLLPL